MLGNIIKKFHENIRKGCDRSRKRFPPELGRRDLLSDKVKKDYKVDFNGFVEGWPSLGGTRKTFPVKFNYYLLIKSWIVFRKKIIMVTGTKCNFYIKHGVIL